MDILGGTFTENTELTGNIECVKTESDTVPTIEEREEGEGNTLHTNGKSWVKYDLTEPLTDFTLEFEFYKADTALESRVIGLGGTGFEIQVKGNSDTIYWDGYYNCDWKQNKWNKLKIVKEGTDVSMYMNDVLVATKTYAEDFTGFYLGRGNDANGFFNGYYRNFILNKGEIKEITVEIVEEEV